MFEPCPKHSCVLFSSPVRFNDKSWWLPFKHQTLFIIHLISLCLASIQRIAKLTFRFLLFWSRSERDPRLVTFHKLLSIRSKKLSDRGLVCVKINRLLLLCLRSFLDLCITFAKQFLIAENILKLGIVLVCHVDSVRNFRENGCVYFVVCLYSGQLVLPESMCYFLELNNHFFALLTRMDGVFSEVLTWIELSRWANERHPDLR